MSNRTPLILPPGPSGQNPVSPTYYVSASQSQSEIEPEEVTIPLSHYLWILRRHAWKLLAFVGVCVASTLIISSRLRPIYESTAFIDVDRQAPSAILGQDSNRSVLNDSDQFLATQVKLIQSDAVLRPIAQKYNLLQAEHQVIEGTGDFARRAANAPVLLKRLKVTRPPNTYLLLISYRSPDPQMAADVANAIAQSYLGHTYTIRIKSSALLSSFMEQQLEELKAKMERSGEALARFERELNLINPEEKTNILSARLLQLNTEYTGAQADRVRKEAIWNSMQDGSLEAAQVSGQGEALILLSQRLNESRQRLAEVKTTYGPNHPEFRKASSQLAEIEQQFKSARENISSRIKTDYRQSRNREEMLKTAVAETKTEFDKVNSRSFEYQQLKREAAADKNLYDELIRKIKEAGINAGFQNNNIRIADLARPGLKPVFPNLKLNLILAFLFSSILAIGGAILGDTMDTTVRDPEQISRFLGTDVIGSLPAVKNMTLLRVTPTAVGSSVKLVASNGNGNGNGNGGYRTMSSYHEAIRTLRNTILLGDFDSPLRSILVTSAVPGEGKSMTAMHLAVANAEQGKRTLLIDGDLRRPSIHRKLNLTNDVGLSQALTGEMSWKDAVAQVAERSNLDVIVAGPPSHRAADLIGPLLGDLLDEFAKDYELIIIDAPPVLGFAEPLQMATVADGVLVMGRAGETRRKEVSTLLSALRRVRANVIGIVLNQVKRDTANGYAYYGYYNSYRYYRDGEQ